MSRLSWATRMAAVGLALTLVACSSARDTSLRPRSGCLTGFQPGTDYFPDKMTVTDATNFTISYHRSYQILTVEQPYPHSPPQSYVLVRCGAPAPKLTGELAHAQQITVPVATLYSASTTHLGMIAELGQAAVVAGVANIANVVSPQLRQRVGAGKIVDYAPGQQINAEMVLAEHPDVLVTEGTDDAQYAKLREAGIGVIADAEWLEPTPLGRAEWIKVFAALTGTEQKATAVYSQLRDNYRRLAAQASGLRAVTVLPGLMDQGTWSVPTGGDYAGRLIVDAGGSYPWSADTRPGGLRLSFETVFAEAGQIPLYLVTNNWKTIDDALAADSRYGELAALRTGEVWSASLAIGPDGGNDYWERGVARPDLILGDLVAILHPELVPNHQFVFYRRVLPR
ncbi:MAG: ABC transporter substrate-binding protein [Mycobacteriaceae bacterium]|nr:ABC transporter substrate-binding protein [Mycobacteriaceae bacterium]